MDQELKNIIIEQNKTLIKDNLKLLLSYIDNLILISNDVYERTKNINIKLKI